MAVIRRKPPHVGEAPSQGDGGDRVGRFRVCQVIVGACQPHAAEEFERAAAEMCAKSDLDTTDADACLSGDLRHGPWMSGIVIDGALCAPNVPRQPRLGDREEIF